MTARYLPWQGELLDLCPTSPALPENNFYVDLIGATDSTCERCSASEESTAAAVLLPNFPNPFDPALGERHLQCCAVDRDDFHNRYRHLAKKLGAPDWNLRLSAGVI